MRAVILQRNVAVNYENERFFVLSLNREMRDSASSQWKKGKLEIFREMIYPDTSSCRMRSVSVMERSAFKFASKPTVAVFDRYLRHVNIK